MTQKVPAPSLIEPTSGWFGQVAERRIRRLLDQADIQLGGDRSWDIHVHNSAFFGRVLREGSLGFGESYMDGWWDCQQLDQLFDRILSHALDAKAGGRWRYAMLSAVARLVNLQSKRRAFIVAERHYDLGNDLFSRMLDTRMNYSCGYWMGAADLEQAQEAKLDLICRKLELTRGQRLLDIGCGWGGLAQYAAERYGVSVVGVTVSREQAQLARERCKGLPVNIRLTDYRELDESFDRIVSVGMFEHVGYRNYATFMRVAARCLVPDGLMLLHTIGSNISMVNVDPWINRYIFPNGMLPSIAQIGAAAEGRLIMEDWHNFGADYDHTLMAWHQRFEDAWPELAENYGETFQRMFRYYLLSCAGAFRARNLQLWQIVFSRRGRRGGYRAPR